MSNHVSSAVRKHRLGVGSTAKAVVLLMSDLASDDGSGIWASKQTMADELEMSKRTIHAAIDKLIEAGFVSEVGRRHHDHGYTVEYRIHIEAVLRCDKVRAEKPKTCSSRTRAGDAPVQDLHERRAGDAPRDVQEMHPNHPSTILKPKDDHSASQNDLCSFSEFWKVWPLKKIGKQKAEEAFKRLSAQHRREAVERCARWASNWRAAYPGASDLHAATYLNGKRWQDEFAGVGPSGAGQQQRTQPRADQPRTVIPSQAVRDELPPPSNRYGRIQ